MTPASRLVACANCGRAARESLTRYACRGCGAFPFPLWALAAADAVHPGGAAPSSGENGSCGIQTGGMVA